MIESRFVDNFSPKTLDEISKRSKELAQLMRRFVRPLRDDQLEHAAKEQSSDGSKWPKRAASTVEKTRILRSSHRQKGQRVFKYTKVEGLLGTLPERTVVSTQGFAVFARPASGLRKIADVQHFGGPAGRGAIIPAREYIYVSEALAQAFVKAVADFTLGNGPGRGPVLPRQRDSRGRFQKRG